MKYTVSEDGLWDEIEKPLEFGTRFDAFNYGKAVFESETFYIAQLKKPDYIKVFFSDEILDTYEDAFIEYYQDISIEPTSEQEKELESSLNKVLSEWLEKHNLIKQFVVVNEEEVSINELKE